MRTKAAVALAACWAAGVFATSYLGSLVNSWDATYQVGPTHYAPLNFCFGEGYMYVSYDGFIIKRLPANGSIVDIVGISGPEGHDLTYEPSTDYLYAACEKAGVYVRHSFTGSTVRTFPCPAGVPEVEAICYDRRTPGSALWLTDSPTWRLWNATTLGSIVRSVNFRSSHKTGMAYDGDTAGGPYLFVGTAITPAMVYAVDPSNGSIIYSFRPPVPEYNLKGLTWDGTYLWTNNTKIGYLVQFVAHEPYLNFVPASVGRIKALYR